MFVWAKDVAKLIEILQKSVFFIAHKNVAMMARRRDMGLPEIVNGKSEEFTYLMMDGKRLPGPQGCQIRKYEKCAKEAKSWTPWTLTNSQQKSHGP